jgi:hypothetical protein
MAGLKCPFCRKRPRLVGFKRLSRAQKTRAPAERYFSPATTLPPYISYTLSSIPHTLSTFYNCLHFLHFKKLKNVKV